MSVTEIIKRTKVNVEIPALDLKEASEAYKFSLLPKERRGGNPRGIH